ncbi:MAG: serine/threonine-protein kinase [Myxococcota bacterium]
MAQPTIQSFGKYQILERIATGATAEIYKARLEGVGGFQRTFAIKRILPNLSRNEEYVGMLVEEAKVAGLLSHANIVQIVDLGQVDGMWYIAMEYVDGRDLGAVLDRSQRKGTRLPVPHCVFVTLELLKGLEYAHTREVMKGGRPVSLNIIHRDITPPNVLLSFQGEVKLTDFGIARASLKAMGTVNGIMKGRYDYMSPEQASGAPDLDQRSDLFSVGALLYEMLTGQHPFRGASEQETIARIKAGTYLPVSQLRPDVPASLERVIEKALVTDRSKRYGTATDFKEALDKFFHESGFIFTHTTLASYVQGLFGDSRGPNALEEADTSARLDALRESPVGRGGASSLPAPPTQKLETSPFTDTFDDLSEDKDQATLIRRMPEGWDDDAEDSSKPPAPRETELAPRSSAASVRPAPDRSAGRPSSSPGRSGNTGRTSSVRRQVVQGGRPFEGSQGQVIGGAIALTALVFGLGLGVLLTTLGVLLSGYQIVDAEDPMLAAPRITIVGPASAVVRIDGERVGPNAQVSSGKPHTVDIQLGGRVVFEEELVLNRGEHRVVVLSAAGGQPGG